MNASGLAPGSLLRGPRCLTGVGTIVGRMLRVAAAQSSRREAFAPREAVSSRRKTSKSAVEAVEEAPHDGEAECF
jgi:hypothetical protein